MLSRRSFFAAAAGALAGAAGVANAASVTGVDLAAGPDMAMMVIYDPGGALLAIDDWANDAGVAPSTINEATRAEARFARMQEIFRYIRSQELPPWPYPSFEPNDLTREQLAANLPVIGVDKLSKEAPAQRKLRLECEKPVPKKETTTQFLRRLSLPCPGRLE